VLVKRGKKAGVGRSVQSLTDIEILGEKSSYIDHGVWTQWSTKGKSYRPPPCGVMDRDSTGETSSVLCPLQAAGLPDNQLIESKNMISIQIIDTLIAFGKA